MARRFCLANDLLADAPILEIDRFYLLMSSDSGLPHAAELPAAQAVTRDLPAPRDVTIGCNIGSIAGQTLGHARRAHHGATPT